MDTTVEFILTDFNYDDKEVIQTVTSGQHKQIRTRISTVKVHFKKWKQKRLSLFLLCDISYNKHKIHKLLLKKYLKVK